MAEVNINSATGMMEESAPPANKKGNPDAARKTNLENVMQKRFTRLFNRKHADIIFEQTCPHVATMNKYYDNIEKIMIKHPMEVLKNPMQPVWTDVMDFYWKAAKDERVRSKKYVRNWL